MEELYDLISEQDPELLGGLSKEDFVTIPVSDIYDLMSEENNNLLGGLSKKDFITGFSPSPDEVLDVPEQTQPEQQTPQQVEPTQEQSTNTDTPPTDTSQQGLLFQESTPDQTIVPAQETTEEYFDKKLNQRPQASSQFQNDVTDNFVFLSGMEDGSESQIDLGGGRTGTIQKFGKDFTYNITDADGNPQETVDTNEQGLAEILAQETANQRDGNDTKIKELEEQILQNKKNAPLLPGGGGAIDGRQLEELNKPLQEEIASINSAKLLQSDPIEYGLSRVDDAQRKTDLFGTKDRGIFEVTSQALGKYAKDVADTQDVIEKSLEEEFGKKEYQDLKDKRYLLNQQVLETKPDSEDRNKALQALQDFEESPEAQQVFQSEGFRTITQLREKLIQGQQELSQLSLQTGETSRVAENLKNQIDADENRLQSVQNAFIGAVARAYDDIGAVGSILGMEESGGRLSIAARNLADSAPTSSAGKGNILETYTDVEVDGKNLRVVYDEKGKVAYVRNKDKGSVQLNSNQEGLIEKATAAARGKDTSENFNGRVLTQQTGDVLLDMIPTMAIAASTGGSSLGVTVGAAIGGGLQVSGDVYGEALRNPNISVDEARAYSALTIGAMAAVSTVNPLEGKLLAGKFSSEFGETMLKHTAGEITDRQMRTQVLKELPKVFITEGTKEFGEELLQDVVVGNGAKIIANKTIDADFEVGTSIKQMAEIGLVTYPMAMIGVGGSLTGLSANRSIQKGVEAIINNRQAYQDVLKGIRAKDEAAANRIDAVIAPVLSDIDNSNSTDKVGLAKLLLEKQAIEEEASNISDPVVRQKISQKLAAINEKIQKNLNSDKASQPRPTEESNEEKTKPTESGNQQTETPAVETPTTKGAQSIEEKEFDNFKKDGTVTDETIDKLATKLLTDVELSNREQEIADASEDRVNEAVDTKVAEGFLEENTPTEPRSTEESEPTPTPETPTEPTATPEATPVIEPEASVEPVSEPKVEEESPTAEEVVEEILDEKKEEINASLADLDDSMTLNVNPRTGKRAPKRTYEREVDGEGKVTWINEKTGEPVRSKSTKKLLNEKFEERQSTTNPNENNVSNRSEDVNLERLAELEDTDDLTPTEQKELKLTKQALDSKEIFFEEVDGVSTPITKSVLTQDIESTIKKDGVDAALAIHKEAVNNDLPNRAATILKAIENYDKKTKPKQEKGVQQEQSKTKEPKNEEAPESNKNVEETPTEQTESEDVIPEGTEWTRTVGFTGNRLKTPQEYVLKNGNFERKDGKKIRPQNQEKLKAQYNQNQLNKKAVENAKEKEVSKEKTTTETRKQDKKEPKQEKIETKTEGNQTPTRKLNKKAEPEPKETIDREVLDEAGDVKELTPTQSKLKSKVEKEFSKVQKSLEEVAPDLTLKFVDLPNEQTRAYADLGNNEIIINLGNSDTGIKELYHEAAHFVLSEVANESTPALSGLRKAVEESLKSSKDKELLKKFNTFANRYDTPSDPKFAKHEEFLVEMVAWMTTNNKRLQEINDQTTKGGTLQRTGTKSKTLIQRINDAIREVFNKITGKPAGDIQFFDDKSDVNEIISFFNNVIEDFQGGRKINLPQGILNKGRELDSKIKESRGNSRKTEIRDRIRTVYDKRISDALKKTPPKGRTKSADLQRTYERSFEESKERFKSGTKVVTGDSVAALKAMRKEKGSPLNVKDFPKFRGSGELVKLANELHNLENNVKESRSSDYKTEVQNIKDNLTDVDPTAPPTRQSIKILKSIRSIAEVSVNFPDVSIAKLVDEFSKMLKEVNLPISKNTVNSIIKEARENATGSFQTIDERLFQNKKNTDSLKDIVVDEMSSQETTRTKELSKAISSTISGGKSFTGRTLLRRAKEKSITPKAAELFKVLVDSKNMSLTRAISLTRQAFPTFTPSRSLPAEVSGRKDLDDLIKERAEILLQKKVFKEFFEGAKKRAQTKERTKRGEKLSSIKARVMNDPKVAQEVKDKIREKGLTYETLPNSWVNKVAEIELQEILDQHPTLETGLEDFHNKYKDLGGIADDTGPVDNAMATKASRIAEKEGLYDLSAEIYSTLDGRATLGGRSTQILRGDVMPESIASGETRKIIAEQLNFFRDNTAPDGRTYKEVLDEAHKDLSLTDAELDKIAQMAVRIANKKDSEILNEQKKEAKRERVNILKRFRERNNKLGVLSTLDEQSQEFKDTTADMVDVIQTFLKEGSISLSEVKNKVEKNLKKQGIRNDIREAVINKAIKTLPNNITVNGDVIKDSTISRSDLIESVVKRHYKSSGRESLKNKLEKIGVSSVASKRISATAKRFYIQANKDKVEDILVKFLGDRKNVKNFDKLVKEVLDIFSSGRVHKNDLRNIIANHFGIASIDTATIDRVSEIVAEIELLDSEILIAKRLKELNDIADSVSNPSTAAKIFDLIMGIYYTQILSGLTTLSRVIKGALITTTMEKMVEFVQSPIATTIGLKYAFSKEGFGAGLPSGNNTFWTGDTDIQYLDTSKRGTGALDKILNRAYKDYLKEIGEGKKITKNVFKVGLKTMMYFPSRFVRLFQAYDGLLKHGLVEHASFMSAYHKQLDETGASVKDRLGSQFMDGVNKKLMLHRKAAMKAEIDSEVARMKREGIELPRGFKLLRLKERLMEERAEEITREANERAAFQLLVNEPSGTLGFGTRSLNNWLQFTPKDFSSISLNARGREATITLPTAIGATKFMVRTIFPFLRVPTNFLNMGLSYVPVIGFLRFAKGKTLDAKGERVKLSNRERQRHLIRAGLSTALLYGINYALFSKTDDEDEDKQEYMFQRKGFRITANGHGKAKWQKNETIDAGWKPLSIQYKKDKTKPWTEENTASYSYVDNPIGFTLFPLGKTMDKVLTSKPRKKGEKLEEIQSFNDFSLSVTMGAMQFGSQQSYNQGITEMINIISRVGDDDQDRLEADLAKFTEKRASALTGFKFYKQFEQLYDAIEGNPDKYAKTLLEKTQRDMPYIEDIYLDDDTDLIGLPKTRQFTVPLVPDKFLEQVENYKNTREKHREWRLIFKYPSVSMTAWYPKRGVTGVLRKRQIQEYKRSILSRIQKDIVRLERLDPVKLQSALNSMKSKATKDAKKITMK